VSDAVFEDMCMPARNQLEYRMSDAFADIVLSPTHDAASMNPASYLAPGALTASPFPLSTSTPWVWRIKSLQQPRIQYRQ
jgi:hypothetical protein